MPIYESFCPVEREHYDEVYTRAGQAPQGPGGETLVDCPYCGEAHPAIPSLTARQRVTNETIPGGIEVSGQKFDNLTQAQAWGSKNGFSVVDTKGDTFRQTKIRSREGADEWFKSQGYGDKEGFQKRSGIEKYDRAQAAKERQERTGSTDSSGISERLKGLAGRLSAG